MSQENFPNWAPKKHGALNILGMMSGTSLDGVDCAMLSFEGATVASDDGISSPAPDFKAPDFKAPDFKVLGHTLYEPFEQRERNVLREALGLREHKAAADAVTQAHIRSIKHWLEKDFPKPDYIGFHGQTTFHDPAQGVTVQLGSPQAIADRFGIPVIADLRQNDVRHGGQGAPLVPVYHKARLRHVSAPVAVVNIGGVGNVTYFSPDGGLMAFDTGPGNAPIDDWVSGQSDHAFDKGGLMGQQGRVHEKIVASFLELPFFQHKPPKSLDRESFPIGRMVEVLSLKDGAATLAAMTAASIAEAARWFPEKPHHWYVTGGGRKNAMILERLEKLVKAPVSKVEELGWDGDMLEAEAFAFLAYASLTGMSYTFPQTTGVKSPLSGGALYSPE